MRGLTGFRKLARVNTNGAKTLVKLLRFRTQMGFDDYQTATHFGLKPESITRWRLGLSRPWSCTTLKVELVMDGVDQASLRESRVPQVRRRFFRTVRTDLGLTAEAMGRLLGLSGRSVVAFERGEEKLKAVFRYVFWNRVAVSDVSDVD